MRLTLDTVGKIAWPLDRQGRPIYPGRLRGRWRRSSASPLHPPGRDVRCIVSVGMLTEGWDCSTVTHIVGLRPFMSQLLCEQVVGRGLRRSSYEVGEDGKLQEEVAKVFGVPFEVIPFKANKGGARAPAPKRHHVHAVPAKAAYEIRFPRVEGYRQAIRNRVTIDWASAPTITLDPMRIPPEVEVKAALPNNKGRPSLTGPGKLERVDLNPYRSGYRFQQLVFDLAADLTRDYAGQPRCDAPPQVLFPQLAQIVERYLRENVQPLPPASILDVVLSPYYGWVIEALRRRHQARHGGGRGAGAASLRDAPRAGLDGGGGLLDEPRRPGGRPQPPQLRRRRHREVGAVGGLRPRHPPARRGVRQERGARLCHPLPAQRPGRTTTSPTSSCA